MVAIMSDLIQIDVKIEGLDKEVNEHIEKIGRKIPQALEDVGSEMQESFIRHIQEDFYNKYSPVAYRRRYEKGLLDKANIHIEKIKENRLVFSYLPKGEPQGTLKDSLNWSENLEEYLKSVNKTADTPFFHPAHNDDELIVWAQKKHKIGNYNIPARPFWNNFVEEQKNGKIMETFIGSTAWKPYSIQAEGGESDLMFSASESLLEQDN